MTKVFVSSKQDELAPERAELTKALRSPEWDNFTFEWSGAYTDSARDVYLKQVAEANVYLGIFFEEYSQATVGEYREARRLGKPILIYLKDCAEREPALTKFITEELYPAHKCQSFKATDELVSHLPDIRRAMDAEVQKHQRQAYLDALVAQTELLELAGIVDTGEQDRPKLQDIFVALSTAEEVEERDERQPKEKRERERPSKITRRVTINEALREHRNLMILGDPGAGKSTLLRYLTLVAAQGTTDGVGADLRVRPVLGGASGDHIGSPLPILIRLSRFARAGQSFVKYFETYAKTQLHVSLSEKFFERALEDGQAIVCLDGLDEVSQPAQRFDVRNAITALANRYPRNRFIVTSRVAGYDSASLDKRAFAHHTIVPFGEKEIQSFVEKWYAARERESDQAKTRAANLFNDLKANERLLKLAENPLMLTIIALVHQRAKGQLPDARVELYDRCAETLIEEWDKWKGLAPEDRERPYYQLRRRLLERAAYWMHIESQEADVAQTSKRALEMKVAEFLVEDKTLNLSEDTAHIEAKQFVALATSRTGILVEREQGAVSFIHLTFQEYFAASDLYWRYHRTPDALWQAIQPHLYDSRWLEVILLLLGRLNDDGDTPSIIVEKILREQDKFDEVLHRNLFLSARCLADRVNVREPLRNEIVDTLLKFASTKRPKYDSLRYDSIRSLGTLRGNVRVGEGLLALARNTKVDVQARGNAAQALGQLGHSDDAVRLLLELLHDTKINTKKRGNLVFLLGLIGSKDNAARTFLALAENIQLDAEIQFDAILMLGELGYVEDSIIDRLLSLMLNRRVDELVRFGVVMSLRRLGYKSTAVISGLMDLSQDTQADSLLRSGAVRSLGHLEHKDDIVIASILALAQDKQISEGMRIAIAEVLGQSGHTEVAVQLLLVLARDTKADEFMRCSAMQALGELGRTDDVVGLLLTLAQDENIEAYVRQYAAQVLGQLGRTEEAVRLLSAMAQNEKVYAHTRCNAAQTLGRLGHSEDAVQLLLALAQDEKVHKNVRRDAVQALRQLGKKEARIAFALLELTSDKYNSVRNAAYGALKEGVGNLRYSEVCGMETVVDWRKTVKTRFLPPLGMTSGKSEILKSEMEMNES